MSEEENIPKAVVVELPKKGFDPGEPTEPVKVAKVTPDVLKKPSKVKALVKNKYVILNMVVMLGQVWEPIRTWSSENPELVLSIIGMANILLAKFTGKKLYGEAPKDDKK